MVILYAADLEKLPDPARQPELLQLLSQDRIQRIVSCKIERNRKQLAGAGLLLEHALQQQGIRSRNLTYGSNGKPELEGICFNLSHSQSVAICAVSSNAVGCDIEFLRPMRSDIARRFFTGEECAYLNSFQGANREAEIFRMWTLKESYLKFTGEGLQLSLNRFSIHIGDPITVSRDSCVCPCWLKEYTIPGYRVAVCAQEQDFAPEIVWVDLV
ncbi:MAG: 4'-phosphopantetheinyl transferase superfamily protein [Oscillospiraceae bacterium]|nr:4'-phosphopantetheinyl transferase superfamily protein [Oscillospiraceae bacterium]